MIVFPNGRGRLWVGVNSNTTGEICDNVGFYQLAEELLLFRYVVCPRLWERKKTNSVIKHHR